jgi:hypothetical protein
MYTYLSRRIQQLAGYVIVAHYPRQQMSRCRSRKYESKNWTVTGSPAAFRRVLPSCPLPLSPRLLLSRDHDDRYFMRRTRASKIIFSVRKPPVHRGKSSGRSGDIKPLSELSELVHPWSWYQSTPAIVSACLDSVRSTLKSLMPLAYEQVLPCIPAICTMYLINDLTRTENPSPR